MPDSSGYNPETVQHYFDDYGQKEWNRLTETPVDEVSLYLHTHYLENYIQPDWRVLEIGAGAGRFTMALASLPTRIVVADLSLVQLTLNRQNADQYGFAESVEAWVQADICAMPQFPAASFDAVVAYGGPMSYVLDQRDRALQECLRVLKPGGRLLLSVMSLWGSAHRALGGVLHLEPEVNQKIITSGDIIPATFPGRSGNCMHLFRASELRTWLEKHGLEILFLSASNAISTGWEEALKDIRQDEARWKELLRMELVACAETESLNLGTHLIAGVQIPSFH